MVRVSRRKGNGGGGGRSGGGGREPTKRLRDRPTRRCESADRILGRPRMDIVAGRSSQNFPFAHRAVPVPRSAMYQKAFGDQNGDHIPMSSDGDTSRSFALICAVPRHFLRPSVARPSLETISATRAMCFSGELTVADELTAVNNVAAVNRGGITTQLRHSRRGHVDVSRE